MTLPSRRLGLALLAGLLVVPASPAIGFGVCGALILLAVIDDRVARRIGPPEFRVTHDARMGRGQSSTLRVRIENRTGRRMHLRWLAEIPAALGGAGAPRARLDLEPEPDADGGAGRTARADAGADAGDDAGPDVVDGGEVVLPSRGRVERELAVVAHKRGRHAIPALHLRLAGPLGLSWWSWRHALDAVVEVVPGLREVREQRLLAWHQHQRMPGRRTMRRRGASGSFESLRDYARGDDPRHIDWKASARHGHPIVRNFEAERSQSIMLCIDTGRLMGEEIDGRQRLDAALAAAVVLADVARVWNDRVGVFLFSDEVHAVLPPGHHRPDRIPTLLAEVEPRPVEPDYPRALTHLSRQVSRRSLLVFFGDVIDADVSAPLATHLAQLARRHLPLMVALRHPELERAAVESVLQVEDAYRRAAAAELLLARAKTLASMRRRGIRVLDVRPDAAVAGVVNGYLKIKRSGAL